MNAPTQDDDQPIAPAPGPIIDGPRPTTHDPRPTPLHLPLATGRVGRPLLHYDRVASTMPLASELAGAGATDGTTILAEEQTAGRGRRGRGWFAPRGSAILCSIVFRPPLAPDGLFALGASVSLGICTGVERVTGLQPLVKWPNDLLLGGRKVAGILVTSRLVGGSLDYAVAGFGLNVNLHPEDVPARGLAATSLAAELGRPVERLTLLAAILEGIDAAYDLFLRGERERLHAAWRARLAGRGEPIRVETEEGLVEGLFEDVDADGALRVAGTSGPVRLLAGDVILGPRPAADPQGAGSS